LITIVLQQGDNIFGENIGIGIGTAEIITDKVS
jgi:hypothetical protein